MDTVAEIVTTAGYSKVSGIYAIVNTATNKFYIGSASCAKTRIGYHRSKLRHRKHDNSHLQRAWTLYGEQNFKFFLLQKCEINRLVECETLWMRMLASCCRDYGYNLDVLAQHKMHCEETKKKISESNRGKIRSDEIRHHLSISRTGMKLAQPRSDESRENYRRALMGHAVSEESRRKMSAVHKGKTISAKHRQQISEFWRKRREQRNCTN